VEVALSHASGTSAEEAFTSLEDVLVDFGRRMRQHGFVEPGSARRSNDDEPSVHGILLKKGSDGRGKAVVFDPAWSDGVPRFRLAYRGLSQSEFSELAQSPPKRDRDAQRLSFLQAHARAVSLQSGPEDGARAMMRLILSQMPFDISTDNLERLDQVPPAVFAKAIGSQAILDENGLMISMGLADLRLSEAPAMPRP
jgi:hypothetical protein